MLLPKPDIRPGISTGKQELFDLTISTYKNQTPHSQQ